MLARAIQHETDHLDGVLFIDRLDAEARAAATAALEEADGPGVPAYLPVPAARREGEPPLRLLFAGTPAPAVPSLEALLASGHEVVAVLTRPDARVRARPQGQPVPGRRARRRGRPAGPPAALAARAGVPRAARRAAPSTAPRSWPTAPWCRRPPWTCRAHGWVNLHFSLLPAWRGAAPVQHAIMAGDEVTGASTFRLEAGLDTGPVFGTVTETIGAARHRRRPARPALRQRRRPPGRHPRRDRRRNTRRRTAAGRGDQPRAADRARRRRRSTGTCPPTSSTAASAGSRPHPGPGRPGVGTACGWARSSRSGTARRSLPERCRPGPGPCWWAPAGVPSASVRSSPRASACSRRPTGPAVPARRPGSGSDDDAATSQVLEWPAARPAAAPGHPPAGARRRAADRLRRPGRRLLARRLRQPAPAAAAA